MDTLRNVSNQSLILRNWAAASCTSSRQSHHAVSRGAAGAPGAEHEKNGLIEIEKLGYAVTGAAAETASHQTNRSVTHGPVGGAVMPQYSRRECMSKNRRAQTHRSRRDCHRRGASDLPNGVIGEAKL